MTTMTVEPGIKCARCGAGIYPVHYALQLEEGKWVHTYQDDCLRYLLIRIETAEEELEAERETNAETDGFLDRLIAALDHPIRGDEVFLPEIVETATALRARVKEAEAEQDILRGRVRELAVLMGLEESATGDKESNQL